MLRKALLPLVLLAVTGCTAVPYKIPLSPEYQAKAETAEVHARTYEHGLGVQYFAQDSSAAGAPYGLIGALVSATIDAIANASPAGIARDSATKLASAYDADSLHAEMSLALSTDPRKATSPGATIPVTKMPTKQKLILAEMTADEVLAVEFFYSLTQDLRAVQVVGMTTLFSKSAAKSAPKGSKAGMIYRNRFEYLSEPLPPAPPKSKEQIDAEVALIEAKYADAGKKKASPEAQRKAEIARRAEIEEARKSDSPRAQADYLVQQWLSDDGLRLRAAVRTGTSSVVSLLASDLADPSNVDVKAKLPPESIVKQDDTRVTVRTNAGAFIGSLTSRPVGYAKPLGNATAYPEPEKKPKQQAASR